MSRVWVVRAGDGGSLYELARSESLAFIGWPEMGDITGLDDDEAIRAAIETAYQEESRGTRASWFGQLRAFLFGIAKGDLVLVPDVQGAAVAVGEVTSEPVFRPELPEQARTARSVTWLGTIDRPSFGEDLRGTLGSISTVFEVARPDTESRIRTVLSGGVDPGPPLIHGEVTPEPKPIAFIQRRTYEQVFALATALAGHDEPITPSQAMEEAKEFCPPREVELTLNKSGYERYSHNLRWWSVELSKIGWISKGTPGGQWTITDAGRQALLEFPDAQAFGSQMHTGYQAHVAAEKERASETRRAGSVVRLLARVPAGSWATFGDVGEVLEWNPGQLGVHLWQNQVPGWHRILRADGAVSADKWEGSEDRSEQQRALLKQDGIEADPRAPESKCLSVAQLRALLADELTTQSAWLVRGASVAGRNLVPDWLADDYISLPATNMPKLEFPAERNAIEQAVDVALTGRASDYRRRKVDEYDRFLRRMQTGDLVLTTADGLIYVGRVMSDPEFVEDAATPSRLRREVAWDLNDGLAFSDAPEPLPERLQTSEDVADFTDMLTVIEELVPDPVLVDDDEQPVIEPLLPDTGVTLREPSEELAKQLHLPVDWLKFVVRALQRRNQIILYGPPGTGKTYVAQALAESLTERNNVRIVQFHPSYAYEDFIAGFRPELVDGQVMFTLRQGPLMVIADDARDHPTTPYVLIIDEINRANLAKVFGELYFLLEYRKRAISTLYSEKNARPFSLPSNLFIIGTMNTADRSIALVDAAMRRRFAFLSMHPDEDHVRAMLMSWLAAEHPEGAHIAELLARLNERLGARDYAIGPSYFMKDWIYTDPAGLAEMWETDILPLLAEHHAGEDIDVRDVYSLNGLLAGLVAVPDATVLDDELEVGVSESLADPRVAGPEQ